MSANPHPDSNSMASRATRLEQAISNPGAVKINVKGAFIVDEDPRSKSPVRTDGVHYEGHDIRLPHHTGLVSHVAVDVSVSRGFCVISHVIACDLSIHLGRVGAFFPPFPASIAKLPAIAFSDRTTTQISFAC